MSGLEERQTEKSEVTASEQESDQTSTVETASEQQNKQSEATTSEEQNDGREVLTSNEQSSLSDGTAYPEYWKQQWTSSSEGEQSDRSVSDNRTSQNVADLKKDRIVIRARQTDSSDLLGLNQFIQPWTDQLFGRVNIVDIFEKAVLAVTLTDDEENPMGHAAFYDYPNMPDVMPWEWEAWVSSHYGGNHEYTTLNSLFVHYFVAQTGQSQLCCREIINTAFNIIPDLMFIFLVVPEGRLPDFAVARLFVPLEKKGLTVKTAHAPVFVCHRERHVPMLQIRRARVEDHDDLVRLFGNQTDNLRDIYGEYFLAELIESQDQHMHCLVAEVDGEAKAFMSICDDVNFSLLNDCFELEPFSGLRKSYPGDAASTRSTILFPVKVVPKLCDQVFTSSIDKGTEYQQTDEQKFTDVKQSDSAKPICQVFPDAFSIQLFGIDEKIVMRSCDFLSHAFRLFPNFDYCIIAVPPMVPVFPLIQMFVRVTPRCPSILPQELYVFHRSSLNKGFQVRKACSKDYNGVENLVKSIQLSQNILQDLDQFNKARRDPDGTEIQAYVAECQRQIVGVAIIRREQDIDYLRSHYNIEDFIFYNLHRQEDHGHLHHLALNPIFNHHMKHFLKEILRLSNKTCLYYPVYPVYSSQETLSHHSLVCSLGNLVPVRARQQIKYNLKKLGISAPADRVLVERKPMAEKMPFALSMISRKLILDTKETVNARIVVVGASELAMSFLETMAYCRDISFNNLLLVSPHGLPGEMPPDPLCDLMLPSSHCYSHEDCARVSLRTWVNVVHGHLTAVDRSKKIICVNGSLKVPYDHLVLAAGQQFQIPKPVQAVGGSDLNAEGDDNHRKQSENMFLINDLYDASVAIQKIRNMTWQDSEKYFIIYGSNINVYCCIQSLLTLGIPGSRIALVHSAEECCFEDQEVAETVANTFQEAHVQVYPGSYSLAKWNDNSYEVPDVITSATFDLKDSDPLQLECQAFFCYSKKDVNHQMFQALNDASLVYDGSVVIDKNFHTNDVSIRAAGPMTKFYRRYYADKIIHANFSSKEVGMELALKMLRLFDTTQDPIRSAPPDSLLLLPSYSSPRVLEAVLPGGYYYLKITKPGYPEKPDSQTSIPLVERRDLMTGSSRSEQGYMKLSISQYQKVDQVVCLSKQPPPTDHFISLYGLHQRLLNNLVARYDEGLIHDFYSYFEESWCIAIFHDHFSNFRKEIRGILSTSPTKETMEQKIRDLLDEDFGLTAGLRSMLHHVFCKSGTKRSLETHLLSFLAFNYDHLCMYAKPGML